MIQVAVVICVTSSKCSQFLLLVHFKWHDDLFQILPTGICGGCGEVTDLILTSCCPKAGAIHGESGHGGAIAGTEGCDGGSGALMQCKLELGQVSGHWIHHRSTAWDESDVTTAHPVRGGWTATHCTHSMMWSDHGCDSRITQCDVTGPWLWPTHYTVWCNWTVAVTHTLHSMM